MTSKPRKKTGPRSEMGRLDAALRYYGIAMGTARTYGTASETGRMLYARAAKQRKAIVERVRELVKKAEGKRP